jgi:predicted enzyme related to lactoylglutathione lyase
MAVNPVCWWEIAAEDPGTLAQFYHDVFGWPLEHDEQSAYFTLGSGEGTDGGSGGGIFKPKKIHPHLTVYVRVADLDALLLKALDLGATLTVAPMDVPGVGRVALITDPQGHMVGLLERRQE